jgi:hypothetical protein
MSSMLQAPPTRRRWFQFGVIRIIALWLAVASVTGGPAKADEKLAKQFATQYPGMRDFDPARAALEAEGLVGEILEQRLREVHLSLQKANSAAASRKMTAGPEQGLLNQSTEQTAGTRRSWLGAWKLLVILLLLLAAVVVIIYKRAGQPDTKGPPTGSARSRRRWFQFRLTSLFILMTLVALWLAWEQHYVRERKATRMWVTNNGGAAHSLTDWITPAGTEPPEVSIPFWRQWIGDEPLVSLQLSSQATADDLERVRAIFPEARVFMAPPPGWGFM